MGIRQERLADEIRDVLAVCFMGGKMRDPRLEKVTITAVKLSGDLQIASVYFRIMQEGQSDEALAGMRSAGGFLRNKLATKLDVRRVPELRFFYDESVENGAHIEKLLDQIR